MPGYFGTSFQLGAPRPVTPPPAQVPAAGPGAFAPGPGRSSGSYTAGSPGTGGAAAPGWATNTIRNRWTDAINRTGTLAERGEDAYLDRATGFNAKDYLDNTSFDATGYLNTAARGAFNQFMPELTRSIDALRGEQVGMGRLNTGFATEDEDRLVKGALSDFSDHIAGLGLQAGAQQLSFNQGRADRLQRAGEQQMANDQGLGRFGAEYGQRYNDLVTGQYDAQIGRENAKKGGGWGDILKAGASIAPMFL